MAKKHTKKEIPDIMVRTDYEVLKEWEEDGMKCTLIRNTYNGVRITCRVPHHTPEEERQIAANITRAMFEMCGIDPYQYDTIRVKL